MLLFELDVHLLAEVLLSGDLLVVGVLLVVELWVLQH